MTYDVSFSLVWADGSTALNKNEAYAFASCTDCRTVAVAFQVVLVAGQVDVVVPQNLSGALNYACVRCVTQALATQLVVSVPGALTDAQNAQLAAVWKDLQAFGAHIQDVPLAELRDRLTEFESTHPGRRRSGGNRAAEPAEHVVDSRVRRRAGPRTPPRRPAPPRRPGDRDQRGARHQRRAHQPASHHGIHDGGVHDSGVHHGGVHDGGVHHGRGPRPPGPPPRRARHPDGADPDVPDPGGRPAAGYG